MRGVVIVACLLIGQTVGISQVYAQGATLKTYSVEEFIARGERILGVPISVEGRVALFNQDILRFRNCKFVFRSISGPIRLPASTTNVVVRGYGVQSKDGPQSPIEFLIQSVAVAPLDRETYRSRANRIDRNAFAQWYELAGWAAARGRFYNDRELRAFAESAAASGVAAERRNLIAKPAVKLLDLASASRKRGVSEDVVTSLVHEYCFRQWEQARAANVRANPEGLAVIATEIAEQLPDSLKPLPVMEATLRDQYFSNPLATYQSADQATRLKLHRFLLLDVEERRLTMSVRADGVNALEIADEIDRLIPERHALAESLRTSDVEKRVRDVGKLSRSEVLELTKTIEDRDGPAKGRAVIEAWLMHKHKALGKDDVEGLLQLSEEYRRMMGRDDGADRLLREAWQHSPHPEIATRLEQRGYKRKGNQWLTGQEYDALPDTKLDQAIREGRVETGMTSDQVRQARGEPATRARAVTRDELTEIWIYSLADTSRIAVQLSKDRYRTGPATVVSVLHLKH